MAGLQIVWKHRERRELELALYVMLRHMHVPGWRRLLVAGTLIGPWYLGVELAPETSESDAQVWATLLDPRYRVPTSIGELIERAGEFTELYLDGGVAAFLGRYERELAAREELRRRARE